MREGYFMNYTPSVLSDAAVYLSKHQISRNFSQGVKILVNPYFKFHFNLYYFEDNTKAS